MSNTEIGLVLVPPGETLTEVMETAGISVHDLALKTKRSEEYISGEGVTAELHVLAQSSE